MKARSHQRLPNRIDAIGDMFRVCMGVIEVVLIKSMTDNMLSKDLSYSKKGSRYQNYTHETM